MAKAFYKYEVGGHTYAFLQDAAIGAGMDNIPADPDTPRLPQRLRPRKVSLRYGSSPYSYKHHIISNVEKMEALTMGSTHGGGVVVGYDWGYDNSRSAY